MNNSIDQTITLTYTVEMHHTPGTTNRTEGTHAANKLFMPEPTTRYNAGIHYSRLIHRHCASLDLEILFKEIKISQNIEKEVCVHCQAETCRCPAFMPGMPCSSVSSMPTNISDEQIPDLVADKPLQTFQSPMQSPSNEEANREVAAICRAPEYYRVSDEQIPDLVADKPLQTFHPPMQSPSDEEANWEVAAICRAPEYYRVSVRLYA